MNVVDWSEHHVKIQPLARELYEAMSRREYAKAEELANALANTAFEIQRMAIRQSVASGVGFVDPTRYLYET